MTPKFAHEIAAQAMRAGQMFGPDMKRRDAIKLLGAATISIWPRGSFGQPQKIPKVGFLYPGLTVAGGSRLQAFREGLKTAGWDDGQVQVEARFAEGVSAKNAALAQELVAAKVDVLVPISFISVEAARAATKTIPVVCFDLETDPVASGIAATLARPGGNVTGVFFDFPDFRAKWIQLLKETIPGLTRAVVLRDSALHEPQLEGIEAGAGPLGVHLEIMDVGSLAEFDAAFRAISERRPDALLILSSPLFGTNPGRVAELTTRYRLPTITLFPEFARAGGLMAYGVDLLGAFRQTGGMAGKVLKGAKPAELPIERPTKFELVVNAKTAKALGIELPTSILLRADEVIE
jgi:putative ABC transport system substrate-binding protein